VTAQLAEALVGTLPVKRTTNATPRWLREYVREAYGVRVLDFLARTALGEETFQQVIYGPEGAEVRDLPAAPGTRVAAAEALTRLGVPTQLGLSDEEGGVLPGVIVLAASSFEAPVALLEEGGPHPDGLEYVVEEIEADKPDDGDRSPVGYEPKAEATVDPDLVAAIRERLARERTIRTGGRR
jgi:hypothetical protein